MLFVNLCNLFLSFKYFNMFITQHVYFSIVTEDL